MSPVGPDYLKSRLIWTSRRVGLDRSPVPIAPAWGAVVLGRLVVQHAAVERIVIQAVLRASTGGGGRLGRVVRDIGRLAASPSRQVGCRGEEAIVVRRLPLQYGGLWSGWVQRRICILDKVARRQMVRLDPRWLGERGGLEGLGI